jgi:hypothetical protein
LASVEPIHVEKPTVSKGFYVEVSTSTRVVHVDLPTHFL